MGDRKRDKKVIDCGDREDTDTDRGNRKNETETEKQRSTAKKCTFKSGYVL